MEDFYVIISSERCEVNMFSWLDFLSYAIVTAVTPGPNNLMSMSNAGRLGFRRSFPFNLGIWAGFSAVMLYGLRRKIRRVRQSTIRSPISRVHVERSRLQEGTCRVLSVHCR